MKLYNEMGYLNDYGKDTFEQSLSKNIKEILNCGKDEAEIRLLGALISKHVGDLVSDKINALTERKQLLDSMNDKEFISYLNNKYGDFIIFDKSPLKEDEMAKWSKLIKDKLTEIFKDGTFSSKIFRK